VTVVDVPLATLVADGAEPAAGAEPADGAAPEATAPGRKVEWPLEVG
jgi:hypothetical protein